MKQLLRKCKRTIALLSAVLLALSTPAESLVALAVEGDDLAVLDGYWGVLDKTNPKGNILEIETDRMTDFDAASVKAILDYNSPKGENYRTVRLIFPGRQDTEGINVDKDIFNAIIPYLGPTAETADSNGKWVEYVVDSGKGYQVRWIFSKPVEIESPLVLSASLTVSGTGNEGKVNVALGDLTGLKVGAGLDVRFEMPLESKIGTDICSILGDNILDDNTPWKDLDL